MRTLADVVVDTGTRKSTDGVTGLAASVQTSAVGVDNFDDGVERIVWVTALGRSLYVNRGRSCRDHFVVVVIRGQWSTIGRINIRADRCRVGSVPDQRCSRRSVVAPERLSDCDAIWCNRSLPRRTGVVRGNSEEGALRGGWRSAYNPAVYVECEPRGQGIHVIESKLVGRHSA